MTASAQQIEMEGSQTRARSRRRWMKWIFIPLALIFTTLLALGLWPMPKDFVGDEGTAGVAEGGGGLRRPFPAMVVRADNDINNPKFNERVALGRLLFFDPILSGANDISCATCHHPDLGFTDARPLSMGRGGRGLGPERAGGTAIRRSAPTIWNAAYNHMQFWDGRAADLEEQARGPITSADEMAEDPDNLVRELKAIPEYAKAFDSAFGASDGAGVTFDNVVKAIAAFERTLTANNSPFDRYVNGDRTALTASQIRGFNLFRSGRTRCFECHGLPTFANRDFKIIGVPDTDAKQPDLGRFDVTKGEGNKFAFKVPTLRNVALNAPYMHNGRFKTLEEVLDFYAAGGGSGEPFKSELSDEFKRGLEAKTIRIDDKIHTYTITKEEKQDLIAFLYALTDESNLPQIPDRVPSGLVVVPRLNNPARELARQFNTGSPAEQFANRSEPQTITVKSGESIQDAVNRAIPGDTIRVMPGVYHESISVDLDRITLIGATDAQSNPSRPVFDGKDILSDAVIATGSDFHIENFDVKNYTANGVVVQHAFRPLFRNLRVDKTGLYGVYPVSCTGVTIEDVEASGIADAAIYVGQSRDIAVRRCKAHDSVTGIEIENSINAVVEENEVTNNTGGILVFVLPNNVSKVGRDCIVRNNRVIANNHVNFGNPNAIVSNVQPGTGILIMAADNTEVTANTVCGNNSFGVAVVSLEIIFPKGTAFDVGPTPENNWIHDNKFGDEKDADRYPPNGRSPTEQLTNLGLKGADLLWDLSGWSNRWNELAATRATPVLNGSWPGVARRAYWRVLQVAQKII